MKLFDIAMVLTLATASSPAIADAPDSLDALTVPAPQVIIVARRTPFLAVFDGKVWHPVQSPEGMEFLRDFLSGQYPDEAKWPDQPEGLPLILQAPYFPGAL